LSNALIFGGPASLRPGAEPLRERRTVVWAYNNGIQLRKISVIWRKITNNGTWDIFQVHCSPVGFPCKNLLIYLQFISYLKALFLYASVLSYSESERQAVEGNVSVLSAAFTVTVTVKSKSKQDTLFLSAWR